MTIKNRKVLRKKIINIVFLLILSIITISTYYTADFSKAKDTVEISINIKNALIDEEDFTCSENAVKANDSESFYIKLPEYIENRKVIKYTYYAEKVQETQEENSIDIQENNQNQIEENSVDETQNNVIIENSVAEENIDVNAIKENDILPGNKIYLKEEELSNQQITILATYDMKEKNGQTLYKQLLMQQVNDCRATVLGYMPANAELEIGEIEKKEAEKAIRKQTGEPIVLAGAYDVKVVVNEKLYEPYEFDENIEIEMTKGELQEEQINIWHIDDKNKVEKVESGQIDGFSVFGVEDVELTALAIEGLSENILEIDDAESDKNYYLGKNYTDDISGENKKVYQNFATVTVNYYGYADQELDAEKVGYISLTERNNVVQYKKTCPIVNGKITIELVDNPFMDKPTGYGFGGWTSSEGTITKDSNTNVQTITAIASSNMTLNIYANWTEATVVYLNPETGIDTNSGQTSESPVGSWGAALNYLEDNTSNVNDRENNIVVLTGNIDSSFNYTRPITVSTNTGYVSSTAVSTGTYILATGTGEGSNAITSTGTSITNTVLTEGEPSDNVKWEIASSGSGYTIRNVATGYYLAYSGGLTMQSSAFTWRYNKRRFYYSTSIFRSYYIRYNNGWTTSTSSNNATQFYFLQYQKAGDRLIGTLTNNSYYTSSTNVAFTVTSLYNHTDYRNSAILTLPNSDYGDATIYNDFQMNHVKVNATGYKSNDTGTTFTTTYPWLIGRTNNIRIGRGIVNSSDDENGATFANVIGGATSGTTGSTSNDNNAYKLVIESGKYSSIQGFNKYSSTSSYYGTVYITLGNDIDRVIGNNGDLSTYYRSTINSGSGINGKSNVDEMAFLINVKSGKFGVDYFIDNGADAEDTAYSGIYLGGYGTSAGNNTKDISDRYIIVEGGEITNIIGGLKTTSGTNVETRIYVKGGEVYNIVGGAGASTTYGDRIIQVTSGTIRYSVSGGSNGAYSDSSNNGKLSGQTLVYIGGNAQIGKQDTIGASLYGVQAGCVLGAGNGNYSVRTTAGQINKSHIIIDGNAHVWNSVYGGGNYGIVGTSGSTTGSTKIDILGGIVDQNVYGGANNNNIYGSTAINIKNGQVKGTVYGGSNTTGTISTTSTINITGGTLGVESNGADNPVLFGGGYGQDTIVTGDANVTIKSIEQDIHIYGSCYGGSSLGTMNSNVTVNIQDIPDRQGSSTDGDTSKVINITGYVFAGGKGNDTTAATIAGNATINVDGSDLPNASVFGGNDINGTTSGNITVNIGQTYESKLLAVYGGGNKANITTTTQQVKVYLLGNSNVTNAFNGGKAADLIASGTTDTTREIYLQGGRATNIYGGSDSSGTVTVSNVYIESGNAENVYGGNNIGGITQNANVYVTGGIITNVYGGGYQTETTNTNVSLAGGKVTNGFGGGNAANVTNTSITLAGTDSENIYGGSNEQGTVNKSYVFISSGTVKNVFGGNNAGGNTITTGVFIDSNAENVYGGGNEAITTGNTSVKLTNATITGSAYGGGNGAAAVVTGDSIICVEGTTNIAGDLFGGGNAAATGTEGSPSNVQVYIAGGTIAGDVYGAANTSVVTGETHVKVGKKAIDEKILEQGNISITGTVFGGGKSNTAGSDDYDFTFLSVVGNTYIDINAQEYDNGTYTFNIGKSIFGSGNAATMSGDGYVNIQNYGSKTNIKENVSIQRVTTLTIDNCGIFLEGTTDRTNEISTTAYSFNRIKELIIKNNTTLYLASGANILEKLTSVDASDNKGAVSITENGVVSRNVDNRIYLLQGKNLILTTETGAHGEVSGMTYVGLFGGRRDKDTGIYSENFNHGDTIPDTIEEFARNSYVQGKHYTDHNIQVDGFYTNYNTDGVIETKYIEPTPENAIYYQWILGKVSDDIYYENIELIATKYSTTAAHVLSLDGLSAPNMTVKVMEIDTSDLKEEVVFTDEDTIPNIEMDKEKANSVFGLTMTTGNTGWQTKGKSEFMTVEGAMQGKIEGSNEFISDNSTTTPTFSFYMAHSKNVSENNMLGTVTIKLQATYVENEEMVIKDVYIVLTLSTNNTYKLANDYYEGAITPGKQYKMFPTTNTSITSKSSFSSYYSLYLGNYSTDEEYYDGFVGYNHYLVSSCVLPANTKITMIDRSGTNIRYYYYIVTEADANSGRKEFKFKEFTAMGSIDEKYNADQSYFNQDMDLVYEEFIFQVNFEDTTITNSFTNQSLIVQLRDMWDDTMKVTVNTDQYPMLFNLYSDKEAIKGIDVTADKTFIYMGDNFSVDLSTSYEYQTQNSEVVYDTTYFEDQLGVKITVSEGSSELSASDLTGIYIECDGKKYFARQDGSYRIKLADAISNVVKNMTVHTENGTLESKTYTFKFETFGSFDGIYYSKSIATDSFNIQIISSDYGLKADLDAKCSFINKDTGKTLNENNELNFQIGYSGGFENAKIQVSLYRRDYTSIYSSEYHLVDLADYVSNQLVSAVQEKEYMVSDSVQTSQDFNLTLKGNLVSGTYKFIFKLYDGDNYIGEVEKTVIIK